MSTIVDFLYCFEGSPEQIAVARSAIEKFQIANAKYSGNGVCDFSYDPSLDDSGALTWHCYAKGELKDFDAAIQQLTHDGGLRVWAYWGTTDGFYESGLNLLQNGTLTQVASWDAEIGIKAAIAMVRLAQNPNAADLLVLTKRFDTALSDGWDEDDYPWLIAAEVMGQEINAILTSHPDLAKDKTLATALLGMKEPLREVRESLQEYAGREISELQDLDSLQAFIEALDLSRALPSPKKASANASEIRL